jgi:hypothetical protein
MGSRFSALIVSDIFTSLRQVLPGRAGTSETRKTIIKLTMNAVKLTLNLAEDFGFLV